MSLKSFDITHAHTGGQIGILSEGFMSASPSGITENIDIGRPEGQSLINIRIIIFLLHVEFGTSLCGYCFCHFLCQILIERSGKSDRLWKYGSCSGSCHTVKRFIPPVVCLDSKTFNCRCLIKCLLHFFFQRHLRHKFFRTLRIFRTLFFISN